MITQAMDPNAQVAVPLSVAAANVEKEATPASKGERQFEKEEAKPKEEAAPATKGGQEKGKPRRKVRKAQREKPRKKLKLPRHRIGPSGQKRRGC